METGMFVRKMMLVIAAIAGVALVPNAASARGWRGGRGRGWGWGAPAIGLGIGLGLGAGYYGGGYYGYRGGCWRRVVVATPYGPRHRRVWVCG
jgi:hypothetical protein